MATSNSTSSTSTSSAFNVERDMIHPASSIVGNLTDFLSSISGQVDTNDSSAEVGHLRDLLDNADIAIAASRASTIDDPAQYPVAYTVKAIIAAIKRMPPIELVQIKGVTCPGILGPA